MPDKRPPWEGQVVGRVRVASAPPTRSSTQLPRIDSAPSILVVGQFTGEVVAAHLESMRPRPAIIVAEPDEISSRLEGGGIRALLLRIFDATQGSLNSVSRLSANPFRVPLIVIAAGEPEFRGELRRLLVSAGASDCVLSSELSPALINSAIDNALEKRDLNAELEDLHERFALSIRGAKDGMWDWNILNGKVYYSQRWKQMLGYQDEHVAPDIDAWFSRVHPQDAGILRSDLDEHRSGRKTVHHCEHRVRDATGRWRWVLSRGIARYDTNGRAVRMAGSMTDISAYRQKSAELRQQSRHDALTDLPRRDVFLERLARALEVAKQYEDYAYAVLLVEIDRLGMIRDSFGEDSANQALALLAKRLRGCVRPEDGVFRFGDDTFALLLEDLDDGGVATQVADLVHTAMRVPFALDDNPVYTTVSIGMTSSARNYDRVDDVLTDIGAAVSHARDRGRGRREIYDTSMRIEALTLLRLEMALRDAIENEEFLLHFQPLVDSGTRRTIGFEALMRWVHPGRGMVSPGQFIPVAEDTGLIVPIGRWAIIAAARQLANWQRELMLPNLSVSVNLSGRQVNDPELLPCLEAAIKDNGIEPRTLKIELTESVLMENAQLATELLSSFRDLGLPIYVDDFGTGYSSLSYLHQFPIDGLKIDKAFVDPLDGSQSSSTMVRTILDLANNLGVDVVAEGVEEEAQARQLALLGCPTLQGYLFSKPLPADEAGKILLV